MPHLDGHYTVFGRVIEGLGVLDKIKQRDTLTVKVLRKRNHAYEPKTLPVK